MESAISSGQHWTRTTASMSWNRHRLTYLIVYTGIRVTQDLRLYNFIHIWKLKTSNISLSICEKPMNSTETWYRLLILFAVFILPWVIELYCLQSIHINLDDCFILLLQHLAWRSAIQEISSQNGGPTVQQSACWIYVYIFLSRYYSITAATRSLDPSPVIRNSTGPW